MLIIIEVSILSRCSRYIFSKSGEKPAVFILFSFRLTGLNRGIARRAKRNGRMPSYDWRALFKQTVATRGKSCYNRIGFSSANLAAASAEGDNSCKAEIHPPPFQTPTRSASSACGCSATAPSSCWSSLRFAKSARISRQPVWDWHISARNADHIPVSSFRVYRNFSFIR